MWLAGLHIRYSKGGSHSDSGMIKWTYCDILKYESNEQNVVYVEYEFMQYMFRKT